MSRKRCVWCGHLLVEHRRNRLDRKALWPCGVERCGEDRDEQIKGKDCGDYIGPLP